MDGEPNAASVAYLATLEASAALILVKLSKAPIDPTADTLLLSAITQADFDGYAPVKCNFEACLVEGDAYAEIASQEIVFEADEPVGHQVVYFAYLTHTPVGGIEKLVQIYEFPEPVLVDTPGLEISTGAWRFKQIPQSL